ncbi:MAG: hypothetical protein HYW24_04285 [Candidatus Aenigmarchaeota archaeon]|nr:hypothetical protein [Candidatus Aenigmarchaeota archaeon]
MNTKKLLIIIGVVIVLLFLVNESRFLIWGAYGVPKQPSGSNCGENRHNFNTRIESKEDFMNFIATFKNRSLNIYEGMPEQDREREGMAQNIITFARETESLKDFKVTTTGSLLFKQNLFSITYVNQKSNWPCILTLKISENGYASLKGCCGI